MDRRGTAARVRLEPEESDLRAALLWLGSPITVLAMLVLAVNDHVLKGTHPGLVTGKLSDVAGLVLAPALLAVVLAALRVPWPRAAAIVCTGTGFALVKTWQPATDLANLVWSSTGDWSTGILRDPTDLVALPALALAVWAARHAVRPRSPRVRARLALGAVVLPFAVLTTAATSCSELSGVTDVGLARGDFTGGAVQVEERLVVTDSSTTSLDGAGDWARVPHVDEKRLARKGDWYGRGWLAGTFALDEVCSRSDPDACWKGSGTAVEVSRDGGRTWTTDYRIPEDELEDVHDDRDSDCGTANIGIRDVAVLDTADGHLVVVAADNAGLLLRDEDGAWRRIGMDAIGDLPTSSPDEGGPAAVGDLYWRDPRPAPLDQDGPSAPQSPSPPTPVPTQPCASPTTVRVTPDPRNGPPFDRLECPP